MTDRLVKQKWTVNILIFALVLIVAVQETKQNSILYNR